MCCVPVELNPGSNEFCGCSELLLSVWMWRVKERCDVFIALIVCRVLCIEMVLGRKANQLFSQVCCQCSSRQTAVHTQLQMWTQCLK